MAGTIVWVMVLGAAFKLLVRYGGSVLLRHGLRAGGRALGRAVFAKRRKRMLAMLGRASPAKLEELIGGYLSQKGFSCSRSGRRGQNGLEFEGKIAGGYKQGAAFVVWVQFGGKEIKAAAVRDFGSSLAGRAGMMIAVGGADAEARLIASGQQIMVLAGAELAEELLALPDQNF